MLYAHYSLIPASEWHYRWFTPRELASRGDGSLLVNHDAISRLERMREITGRPLMITSAYRDPIHNAKMGGAPLSMHRFGRAFDVLARNHDKQALYQAAIAAGFTGFGFYNTFLHVDTGRKRQWGKSAAIYELRDT